MNVEENYQKSKVHSFLEDITKLCKKHGVSIYTDDVNGKYTTVLDFDGWEKFSELEADLRLSSVYWPRIGTYIYREMMNG